MTERTKPQHSIQDLPSHNSNRIFKANILEQIFDRPSIFLYHTRYMKNRRHMYASCKCILKYEAAYRLFDRFDFSKAYRG